MIDPIIYFLYFLKASLFSSGGLSNLPSLHQDLIATKWASEDDFGQSIAIGQISPGPNGLWVISLGYLTYGYVGALLALVAITLPPMLVLVIAAIHNRIERQRWVAGMMRGISLFFVGALMATVWSILAPYGVDWISWLIALCACLLAATNRVNLLIILGLAGLAGYLLYGLS